MRKTLHVAAFAFLATTAWTQPSVAQGEAGALRLLDAVSQIGTTARSAGSNNVFQKWNNGWDHGLKNGWKKKGGHNCAPIPLAGGLPALLLIGSALTAARVARRRSTDPFLGGDKALA